MELKLLEEGFSVCKVENYSLVDLDAPFCFTGRTDEERSLVCPTARVPANVIEHDAGWRAFRIQGVLDFSLIGILSKLSTVLAENSIGIFALSTFNTDYVLVKDENCERALAALERAGYTILS